MPRPRRSKSKTAKSTLPPTPTGEQTALGAAIGDVLDRHASGRVLGVLLLSDGAQRAVAPNDLPPQVAARRMAAENIPLYTFTFGKSGGSDRADLAIDDLVTNESIFAEAPTEVRGQLSSSGFANQRVAVQLLWEKAGATETSRWKSSTPCSSTRRTATNRSRSCCGTRPLRPANTR